MAVELAIAMVTATITALGTLNQLCRTIVVPSSVTIPSFELFATKLAELEPRSKAVRQNTANCGHDLLADYDVNLLQG